MPRQEAALLSPDFPKTGVFVRPHPTVGPARFQVLGERSSGTNLVKRLMTRNSPLHPTELLGWKHGFPQALAIPPDLAVIAVLRNAEDWALSMHAKPWHTVPDLQRLAFSDFLRAPWQTIVDRPRYFADSERLGLVGQPLQPDRDPATGAPFANLFALRRAKLLALLGYPERGCTCAVLRLEQVQAAPAETIGQICTGLGLSRRADFRPVTRRLGSRFKASVGSRPETPPAMSEADRAFMRQQLDADLEARLGYRY